MFLGVFGFDVNGMKMLTEIDTVRKPGAQMKGKNPAFSHHRDTPWLLGCI